ncbi:MAG: hypothetical protein JSU89_15485 [Myxococcales bacterium]|nr:MAG: hypothetical protein JSU89_15485 [Myxococcales bacterium]
MAAKKRGRPPGSKNRPKAEATPAEAPKRRGRPPGSKNRPKAEATPAEAPKRRGRPPGSKNKPAEAQQTVTAPPRRRGRPPGSGKAAAAASSSGKAAARSSAKKRPPPPPAEPAEPAQAPIAPPPPVTADVPPAVVVAGEPRETVVASVSDLRVDVDAPERRVLIRVRGDLYQRLILLTKMQNAHFPTDEHLEVSEQASMCLEAGITVCEADPTLFGVQPAREVGEDEDYQAALSEACTGRIAEAKA